MEVTVVSRELVRPSPPLPDHHKMFKLSLVDQYFPGIYSPIIFFYPQDIDLNRLRTSLSETLSAFYPLAGEIKNSISVDCSNAGALFVEAHVNCSLSELLSHPDHQSMQNLLPCNLIPEGTDVGTRLTNVQVNLFEDGGAAIGLCVSHKLVDGGVLCAFMRSWSVTSRGEGAPVVPDFSATSVFPTSDTPVATLFKGSRSQRMKKAGGITRRFMFDSPSIAALKDQARSSDLEYPSRVEVITAFAWSRIMAASQKTQGGEPRPTILRQVVNLRRRLKPPMPDNSMGNIIWYTSTFCGEDDADKSLAHLAGELRKSIERLQSDFLDSLTPENAKIKFRKSSREIQQLDFDDKKDHLQTSSWCKFGYYRTDFGWGKPVWVSIVGNWLENSIVLTDARDGEGVETWITVDEAVMEVLEEDEEMKRYSSFDPSPLSFSNGADEVAAK